MMPMSVITKNTARSISRANKPTMLNGVSINIVDASSLRCQSTNAPSKDDQNPRGFYPVYVHNVSRMVLEHLQENRSEWVQDTGLDRRLNINPNGTFSMSFPARKGFDSGRIWCVYFLVDSLMMRFIFSLRWAPIF